MLETDFARLFSSFERSAFRLETLPTYCVAGEVDEFAAFLAGRCLPAALDTEWHKLIARSTTSGKSFERVHVVPSRLTPYLRFEFAWGYTYSAQAGERIFVLENDDPKSLFGDLPFVDFWLFDDTIAVEMEYDGDGRFLQAHETGHNELDRYVECRSVVKASSIPLEEYFARKRRA